MSPCADGHDRLMDDRDRCDFIKLGNHVISGNFTAFFER
ncbi:MAG: hypothetical protein RLZZ408_1169 [Verrucomicrobiota bacterium]